MCYMSIKQTDAYIQQSASDARDGLVPALPGKDPGNQNFCLWQEWTTRTLGLSHWLSHFSIPRSPDLLLAEAVLTAQLSALAPRAGTEPLHTTAALT